jgi:CheY-like chemotaxis protein
MSAGTRIGPSHSADILLVEDNAGDAVLIRQVVTDTSFPLDFPLKLHIARDAEQAISMLRAGYFHPSLIILDLNLPKIHGLVLLERWEGDETPVVVFSSSSDRGERARALALGAREFVTKPSRLDGYISAVRGIVERWVTG